MTKTRKKTGILLLVLIISILCAVMPVAASPRTQAMPPSAEPQVEASVFAATAVEEEATTVEVVFSLRDLEYIETIQGAITEDDTIFVFFAGISRVNGEPCERLVCRRFFQGRYDSTFEQYYSLKDDSLVYSITVDDPIDEHIMLWD